MRRRRPGSSRSGASAADLALLALGLAMLLGALVWMVLLLRDAPAHGPVATPPAAAAAVTTEPPPELPLLRDEAFGLALRGVAMRRVVQMLQWREGADTPAAAGEDVVFRDPGYQQVWSERTIDSTGFRAPVGHVNPPPPPYRSQSFGNPLDGSPLAAQARWRIVPAGRLILPENLAAVFRAEGDWWVSTPEGELPAIGDLRVRFELLTVPDPDAAAAAAQAQTQAQAASSVPAPSTIDAVDQALRWIARAAALLLAVLGAGLMLRSGSALAQPDSALARIGGVAQLALAAWLGVAVILVALLIARLLPSA